MRTLKIIVYVFLVPLFLSAQTYDTLGVTSSTSGNDRASSGTYLFHIPGDSIVTSGTLKYIGTQRHEAASGVQVRYAIYATSGGLPTGTFLDSTLAGGGGSISAGDWVDLAATQGTTITAGTSFWIACKQDATVRWYFNSNAGTSWYTYEDPNKDWGDEFTVTSPHEPILEWWGNVRIIIERAETDEQSGFDRFNKFKRYKKW